MGGWGGWGWGEGDVDAGTAAMLVKIGPILLALLGGWLLHGGFPYRLAAAVAGTCPKTPYAR